MNPEKEYHVVSPPSIKILSLNVACLPFPITTSCCSRITKICKQVISNNIDIVCFQECFDKRCQTIISEMFMETHPYQILHQRYCAPGVLDWINWLEDSGLVAVSRYPITGQHFVPFKNIKGLDALCWKGILGFSVKFSEKNSLMVFNTHLNSDEQFSGKKNLSKMRTLELEEIVSFIVSETVKYDICPPVIACGDFNITEVGKEYTTMMDKYGFGDVWRNEFPDKDVNPGYTWDGIRNRNMIHTQNRNRIDYFLDIFKNIEFEKDGCKLFIPGTEPNECLSDHFGVVCEITTSSLKESKLQIKECITEPFNIFSFFARILLINIQV
ncbi:hypothetical protein COB52_04370 [Candidatus Kaiserbacteria bacterium]|nr:MAG: hypothetical protein COB52_04370 [Candidatus Kaiserbacteria bacterium]